MRTEKTEQYITDCQCIVAELFILFIFFIRNKTFYTSRYYFNKQKIIVNAVHVQLYREFMQKYRLTQWYL